MGYFKIIQTIDFIYNIRSFIFQFLWIFLIYSYFIFIVVNNFWTQKSIKRCQKKNHSCLIQHFSFQKVWNQNFFKIGINISFHKVDIIFGASYFKIIEMFFCFWSKNIANLIRIQFYLFGSFHINKFDGTIFEIEVQLVFGVAYVK